GYYNQPLKKCPPDPLTATTTELPSLKGLPSSPFGSVFSNPSCNLIMKPGDQQSRSFPELQERNSLERSIDGYQPQGLTETFNINLTEEDPGSPNPGVWLNNFGQDKKMGVTYHLTKQDGPPHNPRFTYTGVSENRQWRASSRRRRGISIRRTIQGSMNTLPRLIQAKDRIASTFNPCIPTINTSRLLQGNA
ncbi:hypothetical protein JOQ06_023907, partial [Pogonophryne albipinna]